MKTGLGLVIDTEFEYEDIGYDPNLLLEAVDFETGKVDDDKVWAAMWVVDKNGYIWTTADQGKTWRNAWDRIGDEL